MMRFLLSPLRRFWRNETGAAVAEFAVMLPLYLTVMLSGVELGIWTLRQTMLERGLDLAVRDLRLATGQATSHDDLKDLICKYAGIIEDCSTSLKLEMKPVSMWGFDSLPASVDCVDRAEEVNPVRSFVAGEGNQMMLLRACVKFDPIFPTIGLGKSMAVDGNGDAAMVALSAFVQEPI
ncbi:TadE/TadG family type IV pilus assembly protein [Pseudooceanicola nanhaiensis]|uniref:TadE/TadG family type IV pilus assembly protein n=1 Tax=Pseudooceanicola nanhaiensis TaxID=375761 RepID=UPI001CD7D62D|nr:TadE/TadG family type IV pilus assembly protein [Pseudooceanicola nanhaiensis]MCA0919711.1 pilus assembly protein [Pseudooceanicola nanhaiensis]